MLILVNAAKAVMWKARCDLVFGNVLASSEALVASYKYLVKFLCKADFRRLPKEVFRRLWCKRRALSYLDAKGVVKFTM